MFVLTPWVTRLMLANAAAFLVTLGIGHVPTFLMLIPALVWRQPWTPVTYMFLHAGLGHIFFNMFTLFIFGPRVEERMGGRKFIQLYMVSGLSGAALSFLTPYAAIIGASGATFGVMWAFVHFFPDAKLWIWFAIPVPVKVFAVFWTAAAVFGALGLGGQGIAHFAHLGGFAGALIFLKLSQVYSPAARFKRRTRPAPRALGGDREMERWKRIKGDDLHPLNREELNRILDKISAKGIAALTHAERAFLERFSSHSH